MLQDERFRARVETLEGETLKSAAEFALHTLGLHDNGEIVLSRVRGGERIFDERLATTVGGMELENPTLVGAGWDKKGWAVDGLYALGFAGTEVGSVLVHPQAGNPKPRLWIDHTNKAVGFNRLGFNSIGEEAVAANLDKQLLPGILGVSIGKNKLTPDDQAPWAHAQVADRLFDYADYFVINVASPNTPGLRNLLNKEPLTNIILAVKEVLGKKGEKPLFVKTTVDLAREDLDTVIAVCLELGVTGLIDSNTTVDESLKALYGWQGQMGGLSGANPEFRKRCNDRMRYITRVAVGSTLQRIGVGAISNADHAFERIQAGAQAIQVVTGIRQSRGRVAHSINKGLLERIENDGSNNIQEYIASEV